MIVFRINQRLCIQFGVQEAIGHQNCSVSVRINEDPSYAKSVDVFSLAVSSLSLLEMQEGSTMVARTGNLMITHSCIAARGISFFTLKTLIKKAISSLFTSTFLCVWEHVNEWIGYWI